MKHPIFIVLLKLTVYSVLVLASIAALTWLVIPNNEDAYQAATPDKLKMAASTPSPKVMLVGGSNLAFSIDSELMESELGMPVINMGLAKATGFRYLLEESRPFVKEGDLVIIAAEYELFYDLFDGSESLVIMLQHTPGQFKAITSLAEVQTIARYFTLMMQMKVSGYLRKGLVDDPVYRRSGINAHGDLTTHLDLEEQYEPRELFPDGKPFQEEAIKILNRLAADVDRKGGSVVLTYPSLHDEFLERYRGRIDSLDGRLRADLDMEVISDPDDYQFPREMLFDTPYHLRREGREIRTRQLVDDVRVYLERE